MTAAELLDQVGMKGTRVGGAEVCDRNPNFIVAQQGATSEDVARLIDMMRGRIASELGVDLELQIEIW
jgi:UDP-N-acetylmuramate dehydrogenase